MQNTLFNSNLYSPMSVGMKQNRGYVDHLSPMDAVTEPLYPTGYGNINQQEDEDGEIKEIFTRPVKGNRSSLFF